MLYIEKDEPSVGYVLDESLVRKEADRCATEHGLLKGSQKHRCSRQMLRDIFIEGYVAGCRELFEESRKPILTIKEDEK